MKKFASIFLILALLFSLGACSVKQNGTETNTIPVVKEESYSKQYKDESGKVIFTVDVVLPQILENCQENAKKQINSLSLKLYEDACKFAESNLENAANYMASVKSDIPWSKKITFETTYANSRYICFIIKDAFSLTDAEPYPEWSTLCYDMQKDIVCTLETLATDPESPDMCKSILISDHIIPYIKADFSPAEYVTEEYLEALPKILKNTHFYITDSGMGFYISKGNIDTRLSGTYAMEFPWSEISYLYTLEQ